MASLLLSCLPYYDTDVREQAFVQSLEYSIYMYSTQLPICSVNI